MSAAGISVVYLNLNTLKGMMAKEKERKATSFREKLNIPRNTGKYMGTCISSERKLGLTITMKIIAGNHHATEDDANANSPDKKEEEEGRSLTLVCFPVWY
jgi:hypothetical protein